MADNELALRISAKTDEFVKTVEDAKTKVRSLAMQMAEIDKQLKTENVDRVQKLSEKLELAKRAAAMAAEEANKYGEKIAKLTSKHEDASKLTDKQKESVLKLSEQMATAQQKANTYAAEVDKLQKEYDEAAKSANEAEKATDSFGNELSDSASDARELTNEIDKTSASQESSAKESKNLGDAIKTNVISDLIMEGIKKLADFFKNVAEKALEAAKAVWNFAKESIDLAKDMEETRSKVYAVFGEEGQKEIEDWASNAARDFHTTKQAAMEYASSFGNILQNMGATTEESLKLSENLVLVAAAQADFNNLPTTEVLDKITSALAGNYKGLQSLGIVLKEADITERALLDTGKESADQLTDLEKKHAALEIIIEKSDFAVQKYNENTGSLVSMQGELEAKLQDIKTEIGERLYPIAENLFNKIIEFTNSEEFSALLDKIYQYAEKIANKIIEYLESDQLDEFLGNVMNKLPEIVEGAGDFFDKLVDLIPKIAELAENLLKLFGIKSEAELACDAFGQVQDKVRDMASTFGVDINTMKTAINEFAYENGLKVSEVYSDWNTYAPQIEDFMNDVAGGAEDMEEAYSDHLAKMPEDTREMVSDISAVDLTPYDKHLEAMNQSAEDNWERIKGHWKGAIEFISNIDTSGISSLVEKVKGFAQSLADWVSNIWNSIWSVNKAKDETGESGSGAPSYASGGMVRAGRMYQVNDDHGRQTEMFIPDVNGYILNGNDTQKVINNSTNNSRSYGDLIVNVNSYGADAASIADEIGAAVNRKLRISGAW